MELVCLEPLWQESRKGASWDQDKLRDQPQADPRRLQGTKHRYQLIYLTLAYLPPETEQESQNSVLETGLLGRAPGVLSQHRTSLKQCDSVHWLDQGARSKEKWASATV